VIYFFAFFAVGRHEKNRSLLQRHFFSINRYGHGAVDLGVFL
jgi:hypothetical protein